MKSTKVLWGISIALVALAAISIGAGFIDFDQGAQALMLGETATVVELKALEKAMKEAFDKMGVNLRQAQEVADNALAESKKLGGVIEAKTNEKLHEIDKSRVKVQEDFVGLRAQVLELAQKMSTIPQGSSGDDQRDLYKIIINSPEWKEASKKPAAKTMDPILVGNLHRFAMPSAAAITNPNPLSNDNPLVPAQRVPGIITPPEQRLYLRDLIPQARAESNLIEFAVEGSFTNNAGSQGDTSPVGHGEGEMKKESALTFTLSSEKVITLAHFIPASRQVLSDASLLQGYIGTRLLYGLKLKEETDMLTGNGGANTFNGFNNQAAAFNGGVTNQTLLDTLLKGLLQVSLSNFEASGFVMHPVDWYGAILLKDTQGRYLFSDPQSMVAPRIWAKPVVATQSQTLGRFLSGAFNLGAQIWDKEDATVRISENVNDHFIRNMVAILAEERMALTIFRPTAFVFGNVSHAG